MTPDALLKDAEKGMDKAVDYLKSELRGIRTGRASTALVEFVKVDYYGQSTDLKSLAALSTPEPDTILIQPFDPSAAGEIRKAIESADLGLNPQMDGKVIRCKIPALSGDRRKQLVAQVKKMGEEAKVAVRNVRRDANKHVDQLSKDKAVHISEDELKTLKDEIQDALKSRENKIDEMVKHKSDEVSQV